MRLAKTVLFGLAMFLICFGFNAVGQEKDKKKTEPKKQANVWTDPADAPIDYQIQGEYVAVEGKGAAQVVARGNGKFDVYVLEGGLPGAGWDPKSKKVKYEAKLDPEKGTAEFKGVNAEGLIVAKLKRLRMGQDSKYDRVERKSPTLGAQPPEGAVILFDGKNADEWKPGKMVGDLLGVENTTKKSFKNFTLHIEFRTPFQPTAGGQGRGNSGVYVCGREVQVLDSFGLKGENNECGGIYSERAPNVNMCYPPLVWQTFDIEHRAGKVDPETKKQGSPRITVRHNGVLIHENVELKGGGNQGNLHLQNHGNPVVYRNVWLVEVK
ncbi:MAG: DUF1080 domain-containing protein [Gemmataceae bacterium]|nr:DUF1080 domain-containing protein [Gemmataceae bacterium]